MPEARASAFNRCPRQTAHLDQTTLKRARDSATGRAQGLGSAGRILTHRPTAHQAGQGGCAHGRAPFPGRRRRDEVWADTAEPRRALRSDQPRPHARDERRSLRRSVATTLWVGDSVFANPRTESIHAASPASPCVPGASASARPAGRVFVLRDPLQRECRWANLDPLANGRPVVAACPASSRWLGRSGRRRAKARPARPAEWIRRIVGMDRRIPGIPDTMMLFQAASMPW